MIYDCLIIGAGPAGISTALYLLRFRRSIMIVDEGESRILMIPKSHNYPGFVNGISGPELLTRLKNQLTHYNISIHSKKIEEIRLSSKGFIANDKILSKTVVLATGVVDVEPELPNIKKAIKSGLIRHCPVCDAFEVIDKKIAVLGFNSTALKEALFLRRYSSDITLLSQEIPLKFSQNELKQINDAQIKVVEEPILGVDIEENQIRAFRCGEKKLNFDTIYSALGCNKKNKLAKDLGASLFKGELKVDEVQQTSILGFYAAGDIVSGLNQICVAQAQGAIAATAINKYLSGG